MHVPALEEIEKQFMTEFDYVQEAEQLETVRKNLAKAGLEGPDKLCRVPKAYMEYCTTRVLVMEELRGGKLADGLKKEIRVQAAREGKTEQQYLADVRQKEAEAKHKGKELKGPTAEEYDMYISLLDKKRRLLNTFRRMHNWTIGILPSVPPKQIEKKSDLPINHAKMIDDILLIHGHEILVDGYFNGDPHPGNLLLLRKPDGTPQIGLIDYGQVRSKECMGMQLSSELVCSFLAPIGQTTGQGYATLVRQIDNCAR